MSCLQLLVCLPVMNSTLSGTASAQADLGVGPASRHRVVRPEDSANFNRRSEIMLKFIGFALLFGMFSLVAVAQESAPKAEIFGGYQYTRFDGGLNANGWDTTLTGNLNHWFGAAADFSGAYKSQNGVSFNNYTYTFGPVVSMRHKANFTPF